MVTRQIGRTPPKLKPPSERLLDEEARQLLVEYEATQRKQKISTGGGPTRPKLKIPHGLKRLPEEDLLPPEPPEPIEGESELIGSLRRLYPRMFDPSASWGFTEEEIPAMVARQIESFATTEPERFLKDLLDKGMDEDAAVLLRAFGATDADVAEIMAIPPIERERPIIEEPPLPIERVVMELDGIRQLLIRTEDNSLYDRRGNWVGWYNWADATIFNPYKAEGLVEKTTASLTAGIGDLLSVSSGVAARLGYEDAAIKLSTSGSQLQQWGVPSSGGDFQISDLLNPEWYATKVARTVPFALSLAPLAIGGYYAGVGLAAIVGLKGIWLAIVGGLSGAALSRPTESALEAGGSYNDAIARGKTEEEARKEFDEVFRNNMTLAGADAFEIAIALAPTPKWVPAALVNSGLARVATIGGKVVIVGLSEGGEELYQDMIQRHAAGEEWELDPISKEVFAIGFVMGAGMGLAGDVVSNIVNRSQDKMTPEMRKAYQKTISDFKTQGFTQEQAEARALDEVAKTTEGAEIVKESVEELRAEKEALPEPLEAIVPEEVPTVPEVVIPEVTPPVEVAPPTEPPVPPTEPPVAEAPPPPSTPEQTVERLSQAIREAKPAREVTEQLKHEELSKRAAIFANVLMGGEGQSAFERAKGAALRGELPKADFELNLAELGITEADRNSLYDKIRLSELKPFRKLNTSEALTKLLSGQIPTEGDLALLESMFGADLVKSIASRWPTSKKFKRIAAEVLNISRTLLTIGELSATLRQGALLVFGQPIQFSKAFIQELKVVFSEKNYLNIDNIARNNVYAEAGETHKLYLAPVEAAAAVRTREEALMGARLLERIPGLGPFVRMAERAYNTFLNVLRMETWAYWCRRWEGTGKTVKDYDTLASFINHATGRGSLGALTNVGEWLSGGFFSPRFAVSRVQAPLDLITSTPAVRKIVARNLVAFVAGTLSILGLAKLAGAEVEDDPRSADFGKIKIGNTRVDFWGGLTPYARFVTQIMLGERKRTATGEVIEVDRQDIVANFLRTKLAPIPGLVWDLAQGETFIGEELTPETAPQIVYEKLTPMFYQDIVDAIRDSGGDLLPVVFPTGLLGVGVQTYENNWNTEEDKLGLPEREDELPYTIKIEIYTTQDYYSNVGRMIGDATADMLSDKKNIPPLVFAVAQARDIKKEYSDMPGVKLYNINADEAKGDTYEQYYTQWKEREKITDEEELKEFDQAYPQAHLGNITHQQYALLKQYHSLPPEEQKEFLKEHPKLNVNPRQEWLKSHWKENAQMAVFGQAKIYSLEAYNETQRLLDELDIPELAIPKFTLPPEGSIENYFQYLEQGTELGYNSWEAQLIIAQDDDLREFLERQPVDTPVEALELKIANRGLDEDSTEFIDNTRRIEAYENEASEDIVGKWVDRGHIIDEFGAGSSQARVWLIDNKDTWDWALEQGLLTDDGSDWNESVLRINVELAQLEEGSDEYIRLSHKKDAYTIDFPEEYIETYVDWYMNADLQRPEDLDERIPWFEDEWYLIEHKGFHDAMVEFGVWKEHRGFKEIATREVYPKIKTYYLDRVEGKPRDDYRWENQDLDAWLVLTGRVSIPITEKRRRAALSPTERFLEEIARKRKEFQEALDKLKELLQ